MRSIKLPGSPTFRCLDGCFNEGIVLRRDGPEDDEQRVRRIRESGDPDLGFDEVDALGCGVRRSGAIAQDPEVDVFMQNPAGRGGP